MLSWLYSSQISRARLYCGRPAVLLPRMLKPARVTSVGGLVSEVRPLTGSKSMTITLWFCEEADAESGPPARLWRSMTGKSEVNVAAAGADVDIALGVRLARPEPGLPGKRAGAHLGGVGNLDRGRIKRRGGGRNVRDGRCSVGEVGGHQHVADVTIGVRRGQGEREAIEKGAAGPRELDIRPKAGAAWLHWPRPGWRW